MTLGKCLAFLAIIAANSPAASLFVGTVPGSPGQTVTLNVALQTEGAQVSGLQFDISYDKSVLGVTVAAGAASTAAGKQLSTNSLASGIRVLIVGFNQTLMADGDVAILTIAIAASASGGTYPLIISGASGTDPSANPITITVTSGSVVLPGAGGPTALAVSKTHSGDFVAGQAGAQYSVTVSNHSGAGATSGAVTVTEALPTGLTLASMAGTGWNCAGLACSRSDVLVGGASYPVIAVAVNVAGNAPSLVINLASVSGGGSVSSSAIDPTIVTAQPAAQTITFASPNDVSFGIAPFLLSATASSGLPVAFASTTQSVCTISASTLTVVSVGTCTVIATQAGNASFAAAPPVSGSFNVLKAAQSITFAPPATVSLGASPLTLTATATSNLAVVFTSTTPSVCTVTGNTLTLIAAGSCTVVASQPGNANYQAAPAVTRTLTIGGDGTGAPVVLEGGVVPVYSTSTTVQAGSWISIYGTNLAPSIAIWDGNFPIPLSLGGVSVTVNGKRGYLWFVSPGQINLQVPDDSTTGSVSVVVTTPTGTFTSTGTLAAASPSLSLLADLKHVAALTPNAAGGLDVVGTPGAFPYATVPVAPGAPLVLYGVGFGPTDPPVKSGEAVPAPVATVNPVTVTIGGIRAPVLYSGIVAAGLYQINVTVPPDTPSGDQPVRASVSGLQTGAGPVVTIR